LTRSTGIALDGTRLGLIIGGVRVASILTTDATRTLGIVRGLTSGGVK
jgi:hypothetical protein